MKIPGNPGVFIRSNLRDNVKGDVRSNRKRYIVVYECARSLILHPYKLPYTNTDSVRRSRRFSLSR